MNNRKVIYGILLLLLPLVEIVNAHDNYKIKTNHWSNGSLFLINGDTLDGKLKYDYDQEIVKIFYQNQVKAFTPYQVSHFIFIDNQTDLLRKFYSVSEITRTNREKISFYEIIYEGELAVSVFSKPQKSTLDNRLLANDTFFFSEPGHPETAYSDVFYIWYNDQLLMIQNFNQLYNMFSDIREKLKDFVRAHHLNCDDRQDLLKFFLLLESFNTGISL